MTHRVPRRLKKAFLQNSRNKRQTMKPQNKTYSHQDFKASICYDSQSQRVPPYYSRPGPNLYQPDQCKENDSAMEKLSKCSRPKGQVISDSGLAKGFYCGALPTHRFTSYSKSQLNSKLLLNSQAKDRAEMVKAGLKLSLILKDKKLQELSPLKKQVFVDPKPQSFTS